MCARSFQAEVVAKYMPRAIELHNYQTANSRKQKKINWNTLNDKVFKKKFPTFVMPDNVIDAIVDMKSGVIEVL